VQTRNINAMLFPCDASGKPLPMGIVDTASNGGSAINVTNASKVIASANPVRRSLTITNLSTSAMLTVAQATPAVSGAGYCLSPATDATHPGDSVTIDNYTGAVYGIMSAADAAAGNVAIVEV
jgi:hypothetical protein